MAVNIGPKIGVEGEFEYRKQINNIITQTKTLSSEMKKLESSFQAEGRSIQDNIAKKKLLNDQIKVQEERVQALNSMLEKAKSKYEENSTEVLKWQQAVNNAETELNNLKKELDNVPSALQTMGNNLKDTGEKITNVGKGMQDVGKSMTSKVTMPIVGAFAASTKAAVDWETAFTGVMKTVDASDAEYAQLADNIKQMATETASSKEDIAGVMEAAGQLGITGVDNLTSFTKTMIELGDTTNISSDEAATALARFMNITGDDTANVERLGSAIVDLGNNFATDEASIVAMSTRLASAGSIAGLSSTEILALATAMSSVGIQAEAGGTAMTQTLTSISQAVDAGDDKLELLAQTAGTTASDFAAQWKSNPVAALQEFIGGLSEMNAEGESTYTLLDELGMSGIRQSNMLQSLALASDQLTAAVETSDQAYEQNNALQDEASKRYETTAAKMSQAKEDIGNLAVEIGERFLPYVEKGIDVVHQMVDAWDSLSTEQQDNIIKMGLVVAAIGPILTGLGSLVVGTGQLIMAGGQIATFAAKVGPALAPIGTAITGVASSAVAAIPGIVSFIAPFTPYIAIAAAVVAAGVLIYKNWDTIKETAGKVGEAVAEKWGQIKEKTSEVWGNVKAKTSETWNGIKSTTSTVGNAIGSNTSQSLSKIKNAFTENGGGIKGAVSAAWTGIKEYYTLGFRTLDTLTGGQLSKIKDVFVQKFTDLKNSSLNWGKDIIEGFAQGIKDKINAVKDAANGVGQAVKERLGHSHPTQGPMADDYKWMPDMMKLFAKGIRDYTGIVTSAVDSVATDISVGMNGYQSQAGDTQALGAAISGSIDAASIYAAVREGASDATIVINIDGREFRRELDALGVQFG